MVRLRDMFDNMDGGKRKDGIEW
jgi:hypothetical protein